MNNARQSTYHILPAYALLFRALNCLLFLNVQILFVHLFSPPETQQEVYIMVELFLSLLSDTTSFLQFQLRCLSEKGTCEKFCQCLSIYMSIPLSVCQFTRLSVRQVCSLIYVGGANCLIDCHSKSSSLSKSSFGGFLAICWPEYQR